MKKSKLKGFWRISVLLIFSSFLALTSFAQQKTLSGKVIGEDGAPIPGVTVVVKGTTSGTITDMDGKFSFNAPATAKILSISYIGMKTQEFEIGTQTVFNVTLISETIGVDEVVVVGYGTQRKKDITGSVAVVDAKDLLASSGSSAMQQLQGKAAGVIIGQTGTPGSSTMVRIRGIGTLNDNGPLYVIDGVSTRDQNLNTINPNDIETMQVLKDASASAIYGAQAANGVIVITTKKGTKSGQPKLTYDGYVGFSTTGKKYDVLNSKDRLDVEWTAQTNAYKIRGSSDLPSHPQFGTGTTPKIPNYLSTVGANGQQISESTYSYPSNQLVKFDPNEGTDWWDVIDQAGLIQNHQLTLQGGTEKGQYLLSANYFDQEGTVVYSYFKRYQIRANTSFNVRKWLRVGENLSYAFTKDDNLNNGSSESTPYSWAYRSSPWVPVYDIKGNFAGSKITGTGNWQNEYASLYRAKDNYWTNSRVFANLWGEVDLMKNLTFKTNFGVDYRNNYSYAMNKLNLEYSETSGKNSFEEKSGFNFRWVWTNTATYNLKWKDVNSLTVLLGSEAIRDGLGRSMGATRNNYLYEDNENTWTLDMGANNNDRTNTSSYNGEFALFGVFGRVDYSYRDKYLFTVNVRRDGVSRFSKDNRYGTFPSASFGWRVSEEPFMKSTHNWLDDLKFRIGYGQTGNSELPRATNYAYLFGTDPTRTNYDLTGSQTSSQLGYRLTTFGNENTKWETTKMTNVGLDAVLKGGKFAFNAEWYIKKTSDMLVEAAYSSMAGEADKPYINFGDIKNTGFDFSFTYQDKKGDLKWDATLTASHYKNEVMKISQADDYSFWGYSDRISGPVSRTTKGHAISEFYGYKIIGFYQDVNDVLNSPLPLGEKKNTDGTLSFDPKTYVGKFKFANVDNSDNAITTSDRTFLGSPHPDVVLSLNLNLQYKAFDFSMLWYSSIGNEIFNGTKYFTDFWMFNGNRSKRMRDLSWEPGKTNAVLPILDKMDSSSGSNSSSYYVENGSFARLKTLILGYTFPKTVLDKAGISNLRCYLQAENIWTITKYKGIDPDVSNRDKTGSGGDKEKGIDVGSVPTNVRFLFGLSFSF